MFLIPIISKNPTVWYTVMFKEDFLYTRQRITFGYLLTALTIKLHLKIEREVLYP